MSKPSIPPPVWPEIAIIVDNKIHKFAPIVGRDGSATYDTRGKSADVAQRAQALLSEYAANAVPKDRVGALKIVSDDSPPVDTVVDAGVPSVDVGTFERML